MSRSRAATPARDITNALSPVKLTKEKTPGPDEKRPVAQPSPGKQRAKTPTAEIKLVRAKTPPVGQSPKKSSQANTSASIKGTKTTNRIAKSTKLSSGGKKLVLAGLDAANIIPRAKATAKHDGKVAEVRRSGRAKATVKNLGGTPKKVQVKETIAKKFGKSSQKLKK